jgi:splicing factor U2AF 65 kDa subunit
VCDLGCLAGRLLQLKEDVLEEARKYGNVVGIAVPRPPAHVSSEEPGRVLIKYVLPAESAAAKAVFDGRQFDGNRIAASFVGDEDFMQAEAGHWSPLPGAAAMPGAGTLFGKAAGFDTLAAPTFSRGGRGGRGCMFRTPGVPGTPSCTHLGRHLPVLGLSV